MSLPATERIVIVASIVWLALVVILSATARDFDWFPKYGPGLLGPAFITAAAGEVIILVGAFGLRWVFHAFNRPSD